MRRKIELYINGSLADIATDALVLMNYKQTDATAPAAVFNSWSQSVVLPRTSKNDTIFDHIFRADHVTASGKFNALARTPFTIYDEQGEILESGYLKLTDFDDRQYNATLYGGLGGFLFGLMYNSDGSKRSLADLVYTSGGDEHEFDFKITRDAVREAWRHLNGLETHSNPWAYINFAPCYNGKPGNGFNSKRAFCPVDGIYGVTGSDSGYSSRRGHVMVDLENEVDEWAANDLRSYQQRPVIWFKAIIDAICNSANNGGYTVNLDNQFFKNTNPYYEKLWMTLPKIDGIQLPNEAASGTSNVSSPTEGAAPTYSEQSIFDKSLEGDWIDKGFAAQHDVSVTFKPTINMSDLNYNRLTSWEQPDQPTGRRYWRIVAMYQLLAYDANGVVIGGSKVGAASCYTKCSDGATPIERSISPASFISKYNNPISTAPNHFTPAWIPEDGDVYESSMVNGAYYGNPSGSISYKTLRDEDGNELTMTLSMTGIAGMAAAKLRVTYLAVYCTGGAGTRYYQVSVNNPPRYTNVYGDDATLDFMSFINGVVSYSYSVGGTAHSGAQMTKALLLGGTHTPADYLLSYLKQFGLYMTYNPATKAVGIMSRATFFSGSDIDLTEKIDLPSRKSVPYAVAARWYEWAFPVSGRFADYYKDVYNREYGMARINTGFEFDASHNDVLKDCIFKGAAEVLARSKYFVRVTQSSKAVPSPFLDGGKYTLWNSTNEAKQLDVICPDDSASIEYLNQNYPGYDYIMLPKPEFCDKDNKEIDGSDVLLLFDSNNGTAYYSRYTITDDNGLMTLYNEGAPCWLLGQWTLAENKKYTINDDSVASEKLYMPRFRRIMTGASSPMVATHTLEMAVPSEIDQPAITCAADKAVYSRGWALYITDKMDVDAKVMTCKVDLRGLQVGQDLLRNFYHFDGSIWVLNQIKNYVIGGDGLTECEFIKVKDKTNYTNGQTY